jgi:4a-hydroxytetrahydrobiopterin dehydratase
MPRLSEDQIKSLLKKLEGWKRKGKEIQKTYRFDDFNQSIEFVNKVARIAQEDDHHPDILIQYEIVTLTLSTHDEGGLTQKDFKLAGKIDASV